MTALEARAHENLCAFIAWTARLDPAAHVIDRDGVVGVSTLPDWPSGRTLVRRSSELNAAAWADAAEAFAFADGKTACAFARIGTDDDIIAVLTERGFAEYATTPEMVCASPLEPRPDREGFRVRLAASTADVYGYAAIAGEAFAHVGMPADSVRVALENPDHFLVPSVSVAIAERDDGTIVAGAVSLLLGAERTGYLGWVGVGDDARGHGLGDLVTRLLTNDAFARGTDLVTVEASRFGENTCARMGYRELYRYRILIKI
ncbi:MAG: GNAT family N-acetyltransferase [Actinomycetota bacterium]